MNQSGQPEPDKSIDLPPHVKEQVSQALREPERWVDVDEDDTLAELLAVDGPDEAC